MCSTHARRKPSKLCNLLSHSECLGRHTFAEWTSTTDTSDSRSVLLQRLFVYLTNVQNYVVDCSDDVLSILSLLKELQSNDFCGLLDVLLLTQMHELDVDAVATQMHKLVSSTLYIASLGSLATAIADEKFVLKTSQFSLYSIKLCVDATRDLNVTVHGMACGFRATTSTN